MALQTTLGPARDAARPPYIGGTRYASIGARLRMAIDLLRQWRELTQARRQQRRLCELDDHILKDIGLARSAFSCRERSDSGGAGLEWPPLRASK